MIKYSFFVFVIFVFGNNMTAQVLHSSYTLEGTINSECGKIILLGLGDIYYPHNSGYKEAEIENGKFIFTDSIAYPTAFRLRLEIDSAPIYMSDIFIIDTGFQTIHCNVDSTWETPVLSNNSMKEFNWLLAKLPYNLNRVREKKENFLLAYTKENPNSYVALWKLIDKFSSGYEDIFDSVYAQFSDSIKTTFTGKILAEKLSTSRITGVGHIFPKLLLLNEKDSKVLVPSTTKNTFTLIDFWFSHCTPCISQFSELKDIYTNFKTGGFQIIGITTDMKKDEKAWKKVIEKYQLPWIQYWDMNRKEATKLSIDAFPTNFLLDREGKIVAKNIKPSELSDFLEMKLK